MHTYSALILKIQPPVLANGYSDPYNKG